MQLIALDGTAAYTVDINLCSNYSEILAANIVRPDGCILRVDEDRRLFWDERAHMFSLVTYVRKIRIAAAYSLREDAGETIYYPRFSEGLRGSRTFDVPDEMKLFFVARYNSDSTARKYFLCHIPQTGSCSLPPLPNIHADARLCTGRLPDVLSRRGKFTLADKMSAFEAWQDNEFNSDLMRSSVEEDCHKFFRAEPNGNQLPSIGDISRLQSVVPSFGSALIEAIRLEFDDVYDA